MINIPFTLYWREYLILFFLVVLLELAFLFAFFQVYALVREIREFFKNKKQKGVNNHE